MPTKSPKRLAPVALIFLAAMFVLTDSRPAAAENFNCFQSLAECYSQASLRNDWISMWLAGLDCELTFIDCARRAIIGR
jgi:hypothetical protein